MGIYQPYHNYVDLCQSIEDLFIDTSPIDSGDYIVGYSPTDGCYRTTLANLFASNTDSVTNTATSGNLIGTHTALDGTAVGIYETVTKIDNKSFNATTNTLAFDFTDETGTTQTCSFDLSGLAIDVEISTMTYNAATGELVITENNGDVYTVTIASSSFVKCDGSALSATDPIVTSSTFATRASGYDLVSEGVACPSYADDYYDAARRNWTGGHAIEANDTTGFYSRIGMGRRNDISGNYGFIGAGDLNEITGTHGFLGSGVNNSVASGYSAVVGGNNNDIGAGNYNFIGAGLQNDILGGTYSSILGNYSNIIRAGLGHTLATYNGEVTAGNYHGIFGGTGGIIRAGSQNTLIGGVNSRINSGVQHVALGSYHQIDGNYNYALGYQHTMSGSFNTAGGRRQIMTGSYNDSTGYNNNVGGSYNHVSGTGNNVQGTLNLVSGQINRMQAGDTRGSAIGYNNWNYGNYSHVTGTNNRLNGGTYAHMIGRSLNSNANDTITIGLSATNNTASGILIGGANNRLAFFNHTPIPRQTGISTLAQLITALTNYGLIN